MPVSDDQWLQSTLKAARKSGALNLTEKKLTSVPPAVWSINTDAGKGASVDFSQTSGESWWDQTELRRLNISCNNLTTISPEVAQLPALTFIDLHENALSELPNVFDALQELLAVDFSRNKLTKLPSTLFGLPFLKQIIVSQNYLSGMPEEIGNLPSLSTLDISNNKLTELPESISILPSLRSLNASKNQLTKLPKSFSKCLETLDLSNNQLESAHCLFPASLVTLQLSYNKLSSLPSLKTCVALKELHAGFNRISVLSPDSLAPSLILLDVRDNKLEELPNVIAELMFIQRIDVTNNSLATLPYTLGSSSSLVSLCLDGNPLKTIRRDVIARGTGAIKKLLASRAPDEKPAEESLVKQYATNSGTGTGVFGEAAVDAFSVRQSGALTLTGRKLTALPEDVVRLVEEETPKRLNVSDNAFTSWPAGLEHGASACVDLSLAKNAISVWPEELGLFRVLTGLDLSANKLCALPGSLPSGLTTSLRSLNLNGNRIDTLDPLYTLLNLDTLLVSDNRIQTLDAERLVQMRSLRTFDLRNNDIGVVPPLLGNCEQITGLHLEGNSFRVPRRELLAKGTVAVLTYLRSRIPT